MWKQIHTCTHEAGVFEDYVMDGHVRPAKVGLLLSSVDELVTGVANFTTAIHNNERKAIYYALRHSMAPVDFLSEDDVIDGRAKDYALIYVTQQYLHSRCLDSLQKWCEAGGTVVALCGGGFYNEFQKENPAAARFYGANGPKITTDPNLVSKYLLKENVPFLTKQDLPRYEPLDVVQWSLAGLPKVEPDPNPSPSHIFNVPVLVWKQPLELTDGRLIGKFKDGSPAVVSKAHGKGRAVLFGFLPGQAYLKSALPVQPVDRSARADGFNHYLPTAMSQPLRARLVDDFLAGPGGRDARPVSTTDGLVETTCIDTPERDGKPGKLAVPLINWSGGEITTLTLTIRGLDKVSKVRSVERGELKYTQQKGGIQIVMPLDVADMLLIDR
jgi:hypothetical protein